MEMKVEDSIIHNLNRLPVSLIIRFNRMTLIRLYIVSCFVQVEMRAEIFSKLSYEEAVRNRLVNSQFKAAIAPCLSRMEPTKYLTIHLDSNHQHSLPAFKEMYSHLDFIPRKIKFVFSVSDVEKMMKNPDMMWFLQSCAPNVCALRTKNQFDSRD